MCRDMPGNLNNPEAFLVSMARNKTYLPGNISTR
jgi:hypothetical protein